MWRVRAVELIRKMLHHFEIMKKNTGDNAEGASIYNEKTSARVLTYVDGNEREEQDYVVSFLPPRSAEETSDIKAVTRLGISQPHERKMNAAKGYVCISCQSWWQGYKGRQRVLLIKKTNAANVVVRYVRPWYLERMGRITLVQNG